MFRNSRAKRPAIVAVADRRTHVQVVSHHLEGGAEEVGWDAILVVRRLDDGRRRERGQLALLEQRFQLPFSGAHVNLYLLDMLLPLRLGYLIGCPVEDAIHVDDVAFQFHGQSLWHCPLESVCYCVLLVHEHLICLS